MMTIWIKGLITKYGINLKPNMIDNSGENRSLKRECDRQNQGIIFEFTAPDTPQQNSVAERKISTLMVRARGMMIQAGLGQQDKRKKLLCEVISTAKNWTALWGGKIEQNDHTHYSSTRMGNT